MTIIADYIRRMPVSMSCHQFCIGVTAAVRKQYLPFWKLRKKAIIDRLLHHPEERLCASAAVYSRLRREVWLIGDCQCLISGQHYENPKPYEQKLAELRATKIRKLMDEGMTVNQLLANDVARLSTIPEMLADMQHQNVTYAVIDGFHIPEQAVLVIPLDFQPWEIVLATDGYPFLCPTLKDSEDQLRAQLERDPLNYIHYKATKGLTPDNNSFDDRTYIRFNV